MSELVDVLKLELPVWELILRGSAIYWFLLLVFRFLLRRDVGSMGIADLLFVVLIADASSNAMQGDYKTIGDGLVLASTLIAWNYIIDWATYRFAAISKFLEPSPEPLVRHGKLVHKTLKRELITVDELMGKLRQQGIEDLAVIRRACLESDGQISVIRSDGKPPEGGTGGGNDNKGTPAG